jgi:hypothetical protein
MMKLQTLTLKTYTFEELAEGVKNSLIASEINFYMEAISYEDLSPAMQKAIDKAEAMQTPWFVGGYIMEYASDEIFSNLRGEDEDMEYLADGMSVSYLLSLAA